MIFGLNHERWRAYTCADCHPDNQEPDDDGLEYETAYQVVVPFERVDGGNPENPESACPVDTCPRCGGRLSFCDEGEVRVEAVRG